MGVQKKKRTQFEYLGETFTWYFDDWYVRVYSDDKKFHVAYFTGDPWGENPHLKVLGQRFPGLETSEARPVLLCVPPFVTKEWQNSLGAFVNALIRWSLRKTHKLKRYKPVTEAEDAG